MFTGIIEQTALVVSNFTKGGGRCLIVATDLEEIILGESIAVNGVCLTVADYQSQKLYFDVSIETLNKTNLEQLKSGSFVNLERAVNLQTRLGGHYVTGHIDTTAKVGSIINHQHYKEIVITNFDMPAKPYLISKASITVDGVSLTINQVHCEAIHLMLIPYTLENTNLKQLQLGQIVNIEFDYLIRIVNHQVQYWLAINKDTP